MIDMRIVYTCSLVIALSLGIATAGAVADQPIDRDDIPVTVEHVQMAVIPDTNPHHADTDLARWRDGFIVVSIKQVGPDSQREQVIIHRSKDGENWRASGAITGPNASALSKPRIHVADQDSLWIEVDAGQMLYRATSTDGDSWSELKKVERITPSDDVALPDDLAEADFERRLTSDGRELLLVGRSSDPALLFTRPSKTDLWQRHGLSRALRWGKDHEDAIDFAGFAPPNLIQIRDDLWIAVGPTETAAEDEGIRRTMVTWLDPVGGEMRRLSVLPGVTLPGRPGMVWHNDRLYFSRVVEHDNARRIQIVQAELTPVKRMSVDVARNGGAGSYDAFPDVTRMKDGRLICVFYAGYGHVTYPSEAQPRGGRISACISDDEGKTWGEPFTVIDGPKDDRDPSITQLDDGRLLCVYFTYPKPQVHLVESTDAGKTWSEPRSIAPPMIAVSSPIRVLKDGRLVLGLYDVKRNGMVIISDDMGKTWSEPIIIDNNDAPLDAETDVIERNDGSLYAMQRAAVGTQAHFATSKDRGETWTVSQPVGFEAHAPYLFRTSDDIVLLGYRPIVDRGGAGNGFRYSINDCKTWSDLILADLGGGYTSFVELNDGSVLVVYYTDQGIGPARTNEAGPAQYLHRHSNIRAKRFRVTSDGIEWLAFKTLP